MCENQSFFKRRKLIACFHTCRNKLKNLAPEVSEKQKKKINEICTCLVLIGHDMWVVEVGDTQNSSWHEQESRGVLQ